MQQRQNLVKIRRGRGQVKDKDALTKLLATRCSLKQVLLKSC